MSEPATENNSNSTDVEIAASTAVENAPKVAYNPFASRNVEHPAS